MVINTARDGVAQTHHDQPLGLNSNNFYTRNKSSLRQIKEWREIKCIYFTAQRYRCTLNLSFDNVLLTEANGSLICVTKQT